MLTLLPEKGLEHYVAELIEAPAQAVVPDGSILFPPRPDFIVVSKVGALVTIDPTSQVNVRLDSHGNKIYSLLEDTRAIGDCEFGDPKDGTVFGCDRVPLQIKAGTVINFVQKDLSLSEAA